MTKSAFFISTKACPIPKVNFFKKNRFPLLYALDRDSKNRLAYRNDK